MGEGSGDRTSFRHGRPSSCFKHYTQSTTALWFLVFTTNLGWVMSTRDTTIEYSTQFDSTSGFRGVWNETLQRSVNHCHKFHIANVSDYFFYWPEDDHDFHYCCEFVPPNIVNTTDYLRIYENISDYTYSIYGNPIGYGAYYDLGLIDECFPFWRCINSRLYKHYQDALVFSANCEYQDVITLFRYRFSQMVIWKYGLLQTALPAILLLEVSVFLIIFGELLYMKFHRYPKHFTKSDIKNYPWRVNAWTIFKSWCDYAFRIMLMDWLHICLLSFVGNGLLDAVGRANPYLWTSKLFYNYTRVYFVLLIVLCISSALQQVAQWIAVDKKKTWRFEEHPDEKDEEHADEAYKGIQVAQSQHVEKCLCCNKDKNDPIEELRHRLLLNPDWKWQPIAAQSAILFCLWGYLTYIVTENTASTVLGFVVQAASPWSGLYSLRVTFITVPFIISRANNAKTVRQVVKKIKRKFWPSKVGKKTKQQIRPSKKEVDDETRKSALQPEQSPLPPEKDLGSETERQPEQGPLPPKKDVVIDMERPCLEPEQSPFPPKEGAVVDTDKPNLKPE